MKNFNWRILTPVFICLLIGPGSGEAQVTSAAANAWSGAIRSFFSSPNPDLSAFMPVFLSIHSIDVNNPSLDPAILASVKSADTELANAVGAMYWSDIARATDRSYPPAVEVKLMALSRPEIRNRLPPKQQLMVDKEQLLISEDRRNAIAAEIWAVASNWRSRFESGGSAPVVAEEASEAGKRSPKELPLRPAPAPDHARTTVEKFFDNYSLIGDSRRFQVEQRKLLSPHVETTVVDHWGTKTHLAPEGYFDSLAAWNKFYATGPDFRVEIQEATRTQVTVRLRGKIFYRLASGQGRFEISDDRHSWTEIFTFSEDGRISRIEVLMNIGKK